LRNRIIVFIQGVNIGRGIEWGVRKRAWPGGGLPLPVGRSRSNTMEKYE